MVGKLPAEHTCSNDKTFDHEFIQAFASEFEANDCMYIVTITTRF